MTTTVEEENRNKVICIAIQLFFSGIGKKEDELLIYNTLTSARDGDQDISALLEENNYATEIWEPFEGKDVDFIRNSVGYLIEDILEAFTEKGELL